MKILAHLVIGLGLIGTSQAQTSPARVEFMPMPNTLPGLLFDPAPLSGTMLRPLAIAQPEPTGTVVESPAAAQAAGAEPDVEPVTAAVPASEADVPVAVAVPAAEPETPAAALPLDEEPDAEAAPESAPKAKPKKEAAPASTSVTVIVEGVESAKGIVNVALCDKGLSKEGCPYTKSTAASAGFVETRFSDVPPGVYAVVGYHDVNGNDEFDKMMGVPREPYALSSKAGGMLAPGFKDAALDIAKGDNTVIIRMKRLGG